MSMVGVEERIIENIDITGGECFSAIIMCVECTSTIGPEKQAWKR